MFWNVLDWGRVDDVTSTVMSDRESRGCDRKRNKDRTRLNSLEKDDEQEV